MSKEYWWVERTPRMDPFLGPYTSAELCKNAALEWRNEGGLLTPEHSHIFMVEVDTEAKVSNLYKENDLTVTLGHLLW